MRDLHCTWPCLTLLESINCIIYLVKFYSLLADMSSYLRRRLREPFKLSVGKDALAEPSTRAHRQSQKEPDIWLQVALDITLSNSLISQVRKQRPEKRAPSSSSENKWFSNRSFIHLFVQNLLSTYEPDRVLEIQRSASRELT